MITKQELTKLENKSQQLGLDRNYKFVKLFNLLKINPADTIVYTLIIEMLEEAENAQQSNPLNSSSPNKYEVVDGQIVLGQTLSGTIFGLNIEDFFRHLLEIGATGTGKSVLAKLKASQLLQKNIKFIIFAEKRNFRSFLSLSDDVVVIPPEFLRLILYKNPKYTSLDGWLSNVIPLLAETDLRFPSLSYMREVVNRECVKFDYDGDTDKPCPNISDIYKAYKKIYHKAFSDYARYKERGESRLGGILQNSGKIFRCNRGMNFSNLWNKNIIIELDGLEPTVKKLIKSLFMANLYFPRLSYKNPDRKKPHILFIDEGQEMFRRSSETNNILPFYDKFVSIARELNIGLVVGSQIYSDLSYNIRSNCSTKIATGFSDFKDLKEFCISNGILDREKQEFLYKELKPGIALVSSHKYSEPFLIKVPYLDLDFDVSDDDVFDRLLKHVDSLYHESEVEDIKQEIRILQNKPIDADGILTRHSSSVKIEDSSTKQEPTPDQTVEIDEELLRPLRLLLCKEHPYIPQTQLLQESGITSGSRQLSIKKQLLIHNLIKEHVIRKGKSRIIFWEPTETVYKLIGLTPPINNQNPGYLHNAIMKHIDIYSKRKGYKYFREYRLSNNRLVDVVLIKDNELIFIEVGMSSAKNEYNNVINDLSTNLIPTKFIVACKDTKMKNAVKKMIQSDSSLDKYRDIITLSLAGDFIQTSKREE